MVCIRFVVTGADGKEVRHSVSKAGRRGRSRECRSPGRASTWVSGGGTWEKLSCCSERGSSSRRFCTSRLSARLPARPRSLWPSSLADPAACDAPGRKLPPTGEARRKGRFLCARSSQQAGAGKGASEGLRDGRRRHRGSSATAHHVENPSADLRFDPDGRRRAGSFWDNRARVGAGLHAAASSCWRSCSFSQDRTSGASASTRRGLRRTGQAAAAAGPAARRRA